jgi:hypothetical protein
MKQKQQDDLFERMWRAAVWFWTIGTASMILVFITLMIAQAISKGAK